MWNLISVILLVAELILLGSFVVGKFRNRKLNETFVFLGLVFVINVSLYLVPYLYGIFVQGKEGNRVFELMNLMERSVKLFLGSMSTGDVAEFTLKVPVFTLTYLLGASLAVLTTVSTTLAAFRNSIRNGFRLAKRMKLSACDIVVGGGKKALQYAQDKENCVLLLPADTDKNTAAALMEKNYVLIRKGFTAAFLKGRILNDTTRYNLICLDDGGNALANIDIFLDYWKTEADKKNVYLYVELDKDKTETVRHEILESCGCEERVTTFCSNELLARTFAEENPVTRYLPEDFFDADTSIKPDRQIHVYFLGYGELSEEIHRQMVLNNQLVKFEDGQYRVHPVHYHIYDPGAPRDNWLLSGMEKTLRELEADVDAYFPLPEMPCVTEVCDHIPQYRDTLGRICRVAKQPESYSFFIVDTGDVYRNMETGRRLNTILDGHGAHHVFVRGDAAYTKNGGHTSYYGNFDTIFCHDVIVNDSLSAIAKALNEVYTAQYMAGRKNEPDFAEIVRAQAEADWNAMDYFTLYSNIHCAVNLRVKLNLLGLDYKREPGGQAQLLHQRYARKADDYTYEEYFVRSKRNALLAQEHARWNAYHLLAEFVPMEKAAITVKAHKGDSVKFNTKNMTAKKHCCLTTFCGLDALGQHLAQLADGQTGKKHTAEEYDVYVYDEMLLMSADALMAKLGFTIIERP